MGELMRALDVRHDGRCAYDAFVAAVLEEQSKLTEHKLLAAFNFIDRDGNGSIDIGAAPHPLLPPGHPVVATVLDTTTTCSEMAWHALQSAH